MLAPAQWSWPLPRTNSAKFVRAGSSVRAAGRRLPIPRGYPHAMEMPLARLRRTSASPHRPSGPQQQRGWRDRRLPPRTKPSPRCGLPAHLVHPAGQRGPASRVRVRLNVGIAAWSFILLITGAAGYRPVAWNLAWVRWNASGEIWLETWFRFCVSLIQEHVMPV